MTNLISKDFTPDKQVILNTMVTGMESEMDFTENLSPEMRGSIYKAGNFHKGLISKAREVVNNYPQILPANFDKVEFERDANLFINSEPLLRRLKVLTQALEDTYMAAGHDSLAAALEVYAYAKTSARTFPGLEEIVNEMKEFFPHTRKPAEVPEP